MTSRRELHLSLIYVRRWTIALDPDDYAENFALNHKPTWIKSTFYQVLQPFRSKSPEGSKVISIVTVLSV